MKKCLCAVLALFMALSLAGCGGDKGKASGGEAVLSAGDSVEVKDDTGKVLFTVTVEGAKNVPDYEHKENLSEYVQIIELTYTYANIGGENNDVCVWPEVLTVSDEKGTIGKADSMFPKGEPVDAPIGTNNTVNAYYGLKNESTEITVRYKSQSFPDNKGTFKLNVSREKTMDDANSTSTGLEDIETIKEKAAPTTLQDLRTKNIQSGDIIKIDGIIVSITKDGELGSWGFAMPDTDGTVDLDGVKYGYCTINPIGIEEEYQEGDTVTIYGTYIGKDSKHNNVPWVMARAVERL